MPDLDEYVIKPVKGVFQVYRNTADAEANRMAEGYEYPDLESYVTDMHLMCALIAGEYSSFIIVLYKFFSNFYTCGLVQKDLVLNKTTIGVEL